LGPGCFSEPISCLSVPSHFRAGWRAGLDSTRHLISWGDRSAAFAFIPSIAGEQWNFETKGFFYTLRLWIARMRGTVLPGILVSDLVVSGVCVPRSGNQLLHCWRFPISSNRLGHRFRVVAQRGRAGAWKVAMLFILGRCSILWRTRRVLFYLTDFRAKPHWRRKGRDRVAGERASNRGKETRRGSEHLSLFRGPHGHPHFAVRSGSFCLNAASYGLASSCQPHQELCA